MGQLLTLRLFGPFSVRSADGTALEVSLRGAAILSVLSQAGPAGMARGDLAELIWSDRGEAQARASLRQELSALRRVLPAGVLAADRLVVRLNLALVELQSAAPGEVFLDGFSLRADGFETWLRDTRMRLSDSRLAQALAQAEGLLAAGDWAAARAAAQSALALDPCAEPAVRIVLRAEAALGNRAGAIAAYHRFAETLRTTLDVAPDAATERLLDEIRKPGAGPQPPLPPHAKVPDARPTLAVLPFEELGVATGDMFADGVVEEITSALSRTDGFDVIARQSAFALSPDERDHRSAGARLGADYLIEGSVRRAGDRVRITVQLIESETGVTHWSERFDDHLDDLFDVQDRIAATAAGHLAPHLRQAEIVRAHRRPPANRNAYEQVLSALPHFWAHRDVENAQAITHLEKALELKPDYPLALGYMAWAKAQLCTYQWTDNPERDRAETMKYVRRAGLVAGDRPAVLTALAAALSLLNVEFPLARSYVNRALSLDPNNAWAWLRSGWLAIYEGAPETSLAHLDRAEALSPLDPFLFNIHFGRASALRQVHRYDEALAQVEKGLLESPGVPWALRMRAGTHELMGEHEKALEATRQWRAHYPNLNAAQALASLPKWEHERAYIDCIRRLIDEVWDD